MLLSSLSSCSGTPGRGYGQAELSLRGFITDDVVETSQRLHEGRQAVNSRSDRAPPSHAIEGGARADVSSRPISMMDYLEARNLDSKCA